MDNYKVSNEIIRKFNPCYDPIKYFKDDWEGSLIEFLQNKKVPKQDLIWVATRILSEKDARLLAVFCARYALQFWPNPDSRSVNTINTAEQYALGNISDAELKKAEAAAEAAAAAAAGSAAWAAAWAVAWAAAEAAAAAAAGSAVEAAAGAVAWAAAQAAAQAAAGSAVYDEFINEIIRLITPVSDAVINNTDKKIKLTQSGTKHDSGKLRIELVPVEALEAIARAMTYGANKYGDWNWSLGIAHSRLFGAALRHMWAYFRGEDIDKESGNHHLDHALASLAMLRASIQNSIGKDDRPTYMHPVEEQLEDPSYIRKV